MKKLLNWQVGIAVILIALSVVFYSIHYFIFKDLHHIFLYLVGDIAFLFVDVLIVMLVLHRLLVYREKQSILKKLNMVIGTFFSEVGTELLKKCALFDPELTGVGCNLVVTTDWEDKDFAKARKAVKGHESKINSKAGNLVDMKNFLVGERPFLLNLLENPNLFCLICSRTPTS